MRVAPVRALARAGRGRAARWSPPRARGVRGRRACRRGSTRPRPRRRPSRRPRPTGRAASGSVGERHPTAEAGVGGCDPLEWLAIHGAQCAHPIASMHDGDPATAPGRGRRSRPNGRWTTSDWRTSAPADRPYVVANMVASADGRSTVDGASAKLSGPGRPRPLPCAARPGRRRAGRHGDAAHRALPAAHPRPRAARRAARPGTAARPAGGGPVAVRRSPGHRDALRPRAAPGDLRRRRRGTRRCAAARARGARRAQPPVRGRARRCWARFSAAGLVDELFLALSPLIAGGEGPTAVAGPPLLPPVTLQLLHVLEHQDMLFMRYRIGMPRG